MGRELVRSFQHLVRRLVRSPRAPLGEQAPLFYRSSPADPSSRLAFYLAGRYARRQELRAVAEELQELGHAVTSRWLFVDASLPDRLLPRGGRPAEIAEMDFDDVKRADVCLAFTEPANGPQGRGGRHVELGIALALGQRVVVVGPREHIFHCLPHVEQYENWAEARLQLWPRGMHSRVQGVAAA